MYMDPEIERIIKEQIKKLPDEIRTLFTDPELGNKILNIGKKNGIINIEQLGTFQTETNLVMLGLVHPDDYPDELKNQLNLSGEKVNNIVNDVNEQIFKGIREKLKEVYEKTDETSDDAEKPKKPENNFESREELLKAIENPGKVMERLESEKELPDGHPILNQKLSGTFSVPKVETDHSIGNLSKNSDSETTKLPPVDPYRMPIE